MARAPVVLLLAALLASCAVEPPRPSPAPPVAAPSAAPHAAPVAAPGREPFQPAPFSTALSLEGYPPGWRPYRLARFKKPTDFRLVHLDGRTVMRATADSSASGLQYDTVVDPHEYPWLTWHWQVPALIEGANNTLQHVEDSPARVIVTFEGGREKLPPGEQINYDLAKAVSGNELPYATLMYIWENKLPEGAIIDHHFTTRIKMIVVASGAKDLNWWHEERVNVLEDFRRAFGEEPPRVKSIGIMTDSDNTGKHAVAYYGDIRFARR